MILTTEQALRFYRLWIPLLDYVNQKHRVDQSLYGMTSPKGLPIASIKKIRDKLWSDRQLIDSYVQHNPNHLSDADLAILMGWKNAIVDSFTVLRHLKSGSIFIPMSVMDAAYIVSGIYSPWDEMLRGAPLPQVIDAVLIPFENKIICDSVIVPYRVRLVGQMRSSMNEHYRVLKASGRVFKTVPDKGWVGLTISVVDVMEALSEVVG